MNRLGKEKSPYLLQHANNPVDWYPWGEEAFETARREDKPIFLSIGYATCHWCHVMEHESFENEDIASALNEAFVCIKVDREERPDVDAIYMLTCQMMTGQGGWPLSIVMTPDQKPFYAATYIPPQNRYGRMGMDKLIPALSKAWKEQRDEVLNSAKDILNTLQRQQPPKDEDGLSEELIEVGYKELIRQYDQKHGGFGSAPKFPTPHRLLFLLRQGESEGVQAVEHTLQAMRMGGVFDQIGYGFHRYSTDPIWLLPHFEKMLYDQALMVMAYLEAYELSGNKLLAEYAEEVLHYVERDMTDPLGGFYSAEDADSEGEEGLFYIWSAEEMHEILGESFDMISELWNIKRSGNFHDESTGAASPLNIPHLTAPPSDEERQLLDTARLTLFPIREQRIHPLKDTKVLADWNGLMIAAFARAASVLGNDHYLQIAQQAYHFIDTRMKTQDGRLWHRWREGETAVPGQLEDYVFIIHGLLELYSSSFDLNYLEAALEYHAIIHKEFLDVEGGGYFMTSDLAEKLLTRPKSLYDGATPSGNSLHMLNLLRLARLTGRTDLETQAMEIGKAYTAPLKRSPSNISQTLIALQLLYGKSQEVVVVGPIDHSETQAMLNLLQADFDPHRIILHKEPANQDRLSELVPFTTEMHMLEDKPTVYICQNFTCDRPINSLSDLKTKMHN